MFVKICVIGNCGDYLWGFVLLNRYFIVDNSDYDRIDEVCYVKYFKMLRI